VVNEQNVMSGVRAIWSVLAHRGLVPPGEEPPGFAMPPKLEGRVLRYTHRPVSSTSGIIRFLVRAGDLVRRRQAVARVFNAFGRLMETIRAPGEGIVLGHTDSAVAFPGVPVVAFGLV
jgi:predicted deacylase